MLASGIKGMHIQLRFESELHGSAFMRRRLGCPVCLQRGAPPPVHSWKRGVKIHKSTFSEYKSKSLSGLFFIQYII